MPRAVGQALMSDAEYHVVIFENVVANWAPWLDDLRGPRKILGAWAPGPPLISTPVANKIYWQEII